MMAGKRQRHRNQLEERHIERDEDQQREVGRNTGDTVVNQHEQQHDDDAKNACANAQVDRLLTERCADCFCAFDCQRDRQRTGAKLKRKLVRGLLGEVSLNHAARVEAGVNGRRRDDRTVKHNRQRLTDVGACKRPKHSRAIGCELEGDHPLVVGLQLRRRRLQPRTCHNGRERLPGLRVDGAIARSVATRLIFHLIIGQDFLACEVVDLPAHAAEIDKFQQRGLLNGVDSLLLIGDARKFDENAVRANDLHGRLGHAESIHTFGDVVRRLLHVADREAACRKLRGQQNTQPAHQVETQTAA